MTYQYLRIKKTLSRSAFAFCAVFLSPAVSTLGFDTTTEFAILPADEALHSFSYDAMFTDFEDNTAAVSGTIMMPEGKSAEIMVSAYQIVVMARTVPQGREFTFAVREKATNDLVNSAQIVAGEKDGMEFESESFEPTAAIRSISFRLSPIKATTAM